MKANPKQVKVRMELFECCVSILIILMSLAYTKSMETNYRRTKTTVSLINSHFVFCPRYRRKIFKNRELEQRFKELVFEICDSFELEIIAIECDQDYAHIFLSAIPTMSPSEIMAKIKGGTSRKLRDEFEHLQHLPSLWTRSYFVSTAGNVSSETIQHYVKNQKMRG